MRIPRQSTSAFVILVALAISATQLPAKDGNGHILIGPKASPMEQYAARELQRYLYQVSGSLLTIDTAQPGSTLSGRVFLLGTLDSNPLIAELA
jgi:hypothetical protein